MFIAGLELHLDDLVKSGKISAFAGFLGFLAPLVLGFFMAQIFAFDLKQSLFIGLLLAPTSVSISAQTLMELNALRTRTGVGLLGAAVIDDMLVVLGLSLFTAVVVGGGNGSLGDIGLMVLEMVLFLAAAIVLGIWVLPKITKFIAKVEISQAAVAFTFILMLLFAWAAESLGHMATIIGSFMAGIFFSRTNLKRKLESSFFCHSLWYFCADLFYQYWSFCRCSTDRCRRPGAAGRFYSGSCSLKNYWFRNRRVIGRFNPS